MGLHRRFTAKCGGLNMLGDFILWLRRFLKQNFFCIHHYVWCGPLDFRYEICEKCGKLRKNNKYFR